MLVVGLVVLTGVAACIAAPGLVAPHPPNASLGAPLEPPSADFMLGTDEVGRDIASRLIWAARADVALGLAATTLSLLVGVPLGILSAIVGGRLSAVVLRMTDILLSFPSILLAVFLVAVFGHGNLVLIAALALIFLSAWVRLARGLAISAMSRGYVEAAEVSGAGALHVMTWHVLPNAFGTLLVGYALAAATALTLTSSLSYLGLGVQPPTASWGVMLQNSVAYIYVDPLYAVLPGMCVTLVALAYTWVADGVNARSARRETLSTLLSAEGP
jgi:peptide/nickel transport system permease protein